MHDDRHRRHRRADADPRRRPVDGYRTSDRPRFERLVEDAVRTLPDELFDLLASVQVTIVDVPPDLPSPPGDPHEGVVLATYVAAGRGRRRPGARLTLYRRPLEARAQTRAELIDLVREVVVHELATQHGIDDDHLGDLGF